ncbi:hypothetical protein GCM10023322_43810 [Rugosimonospora acidiphila]|uniref:Uncharacterized protein n=1 Tax=Rugosimonospora acidiphila TaxID=556531 RepID=A0ABP9S0P7_9ACTN
MNFVTAFEPDRWMLRVAAGTQHHIVTAFIRRDGEHNTNRSGTDHGDSLRHDNSYRVVDDR